MKKEESKLKIIGKIDISSIINKDKRIYNKSNKNQNFIPLTLEEEQGISNDKELQEYYNKCNKRGEPIDNDIVDSIQNQRYLL